MDPDGRAADEEPLDTPLAYVTFPVEQTVPATFTYAGELQPVPVPDLDDGDS